MPQLEPYVSLPIVRRLGGCAPGEAATQTSVGVLRVREHLGVARRGGEAERREYVPTAFQRLDGSAELVLSGSGARMRLRSSRGWVTLTPEQIGWEEAAARPRSAARLEPTTSERAVRRFAEQVLTDETLRASVTGLHRDLWIAMVEHAAITETAPAAVLQPVLATTGAAIGTSTQPPASGTETCNVERKVTLIEEEVKGWVHRVTTAAEQAAECSRRCDGKWGWDWLTCTAGCVIGFFADIVTSTWEVIGTITRESVTLITHCTPTATIPSYTTAVPERAVLQVNGVVPFDTSAGRDDRALTAAVKEVLQTVDAVTGCVLQGSWTGWRHDFDPRDPEKALIGVQVCMDGACAKKLRDSLTGGTLAAAIRVLQALVATPGGADAVLAAMDQIVSTKTAIQALVAATGISAAAAAGIVLGFLILVSYQALAITGQLWIMGEKGIANGICLRHPSLLLGAGFFLQPAVSLSWPVTVSKR